MPQINRIRIINFSYNNDKRQILDEHFNFYQGQNALLSLKNGGGKSVLVQLMMQPITPLTKIQNRNMKDFFKKKKTPAYVLIEWKLEDSGGYLLTGICIASKDMQGREIQESDASLRYFTFTNQYSRSDEFDLKNIPLCRKEHGGTYILSYKEATELIQEKTRERKSEVVYYGSDDNVRYAKNLLSFNISQDEWRNIIKQINSDEGGVINIFEKCKTSHQLMKEWLLKTVEKVVYKNKEEHQQLEAMLQGLVDHMVENEQFIFEKRLLMEFMEKMESLVNELEQLSDIHEQKKILEMDIARMHRYLESQVQSLEEGIMEKEEEIEQNNRNLSLINLEERSHAYHKCSYRYERLKFDHARVRGELDRTLEVLNGKRRNEKVQQAAQILMDLRKSSREKAGLEEAIRRLQGETEEKVLLEQLRYSLKLQYDKRLEAYSQEASMLQEKIACGEERINGFGPAIRSLEEEARSLGYAKQGLEMRIKDFLKAEEVMKRELEVSILRNVFEEAEEKDLIREEKRLKGRLDFSVEEKLSLERQQKEKRSRREPVRLRLKEIDQDGLETGIAISRTESERKGFLEEEEEIRSILSKYDIGFDRRFEAEVLKRIFKGLITEYENSAFHFMNIVNGVEERLASLKKGTMHISEAYAEFLDQRDINYDTGEGYLRKLEPEQRESLLREIPLLPYAFILSDADMEKVRYSLPEKPILQLVPLLTYGSLQGSLNANGNLVELRAGASFLCLFDEKMLSSSDLEAYRQELEVEKKDARESLEHFNRLLRSTQEDAVRVSAFKFQDGHLHELDKELDTLESRRRDLAMEKGKLDEEMAVLEETLDRLQDKVYNQENSILDSRKGVDRFMEYLEANREYEHSVKKVKELEAEIEEAYMRLETARGALDGEREAKYLLRRQKDRLEQDSREADSKAARYTDAVEAEIIDEELDILEARFDTLMRQNSSNLEALQRSRADVIRFYKDKEKALDSMNLHESEYADVRFDEGLLSQLQREIEDMVKTKESQEKEERRLDKEAGMAMVKKDGALEEVYRLSDKVIPREEIRPDFDGRRKACSEQRKNLSLERSLLENEVRKIGKMINEVERVIHIGVLEVHGEYAVRKNLQEDFEDIRDRLVELKASYERIEKNADRRYDSLEREYSGKNPNIQNIFRGLAPVRNQARENPDNYYYFYERTTTLREKLHELIRLYQSKLENLEQEKKNMVIQSYHQARTIYKEIQKVTEDSAIHLAGRTRPVHMLKVDMVPPGEGEKDMEKMNDYIERCAESIRVEMKEEKRTEEIRKTINKYMSNWELLNVISDLSGLVIHAYKIDISSTNSGYKTWEQVMKENSGGERFVSFFAVLVALMSYTRTRSRIGDDYTRNKDTKVLLMDNPFGPISSEHLLIPLFDIAKKYNTQMICLTDLKQNSILNRFQVIYMLKICSNTFGTMEYLKVEENQREGEDLKFDENLEKAVLRSGDYEQISMI